VALIESRDMDGGQCPLVASSALSGENEPDYRCTCHQRNRELREQSWRLQSHLAKGYGTNATTDHEAVTCHLLARAARKNRI